MTTPRLVSIIIPTLNEEGTIAGTLRRVHQQEAPVEILVADGGSTDNTRSVARAHGATVLKAPRGRATQMNHGATHSAGRLLLFLHADTQLPPDGVSLIRQSLSPPDATAGTFRLRFDDPTPLLRFYAWCTGWPWIRLCFGDRGQFVERSAFESVGGFPDWPLFEDLELAARLQKHGGFRFLNASVKTSARRFRRHGPLRQQLLNLYLWTHYLWGTDPDQLASLYPAHTDD
ncbi:TIGR04283 family arsenosugar biosynthesis glycosyltransferase [Salinibacter altiplanensis]|uniref:TIGR04283 family arsenosugar biosynthesis glycosyltransferase n=1 Tax=Salinibacter altiplanensis TaxID=1803181 RepID=UPI000C9EE43A|nr:TIGR04283 family arsenosugar biosynthesis glycosyltransferase [Salinibacter altiplanensis]